MSLADKLIVYSPLSQFTVALMRSCISIVFIISHIISNTILFINAISPIYATQNNTLISISRSEKILVKKLPHPLKKKKRCETHNAISRRQATKAFAEHSLFDLPWSANAHNQRGKFWCLYYIPSVNYKSTNSHISINYSSSRRHLLFTFPFIVN